MGAAKKSDETVRADNRVAATLGRTGIAALSLAAVCKAVENPDATPLPGAMVVAQADAGGDKRAVFVANDALKPVPEAEAPPATRERDSFTLTKLKAFQKPPLEEELIEPGDGVGACTCNTVCSCVPVQACSCNSVCTCDTVASCANHTSGGGGGGGGGGGYGGYFCFW